MAALPLLSFFRPRRAGLPGFGGRRKPPPGRAVSLVLMLLAAAFGCMFCQGKVLRVHDGDTLTLLRGAELLKVRLYGVDAPESSQRGGPESTSFLADLASFQNVDLDVRDKDRYGRIVAIARLPDGRTLNEELVRAGHAWVYPAHCKSPVCLKWLALEQRARLKGQGLWKDKKLQPPWQWRQKHMRNR